MKKMLKFWATVAAGLLALWGVLRFYDFGFANNDGLLADIDLNVMLGYLLTLVGLLAAATLATKSRFEWVTNVAASLSSLLFFWVLAEIICFALIRLGITDAPKPFHSRLLLNENWSTNWTQFWGDISPVFGRWRLPQATMRLPICTDDTTTLNSNRFGMRDAERTLANPSGKRRAVFVGDSFVEGYLVNAPQRYSNLLEAQTGLEHLNFGINGTSPINYYLTYDSLVRQFDHDLVVITLLPANDFEDYDESQKLGLLRYPIYRPYWRGEFPNVSLAYSLSDIRQSIASPNNYHQPKRVQRTVDSLYQTLGFGQKLVAEIQLNSYLYSSALYWASRQHSGGGAAGQERLLALPNSYAQETFESRWPALEYSLTKLLKAAEGKKVILVGMPILSDLQNYDQKRKDDLSPRLLTLCQRFGATYLNLLPAFHALGEKGWSRLYVACDGHFSSKGEQKVAEIILQNPAYREAMGLNDVKVVTESVTK